MTRISLSGALNWRFPAFAGLQGFRGEVILVLLVALTSLAVINPTNPQDTSRLGLTEALLLGHTVKTDQWGGRDSLDVAFRAGHYYSDKAPGVSFVSLAPFGVTELLDHSVYHTESLPVWSRLGHLWFIRITAVGLFFLLGVLLVGRAAERVAPGTGALVALAFGLGTIAGAIAPTSFGHDPAASLGFLAFVLLSAASPRRSLLIGAGAAAGAAVLFDYTAALVCVVLAVWLAARHRWRGLTWFAVGGLPFALLLGLYDRVAFGSPFHLSYGYVDNRFASDQAKGLFGIGVPRAHGVELTLVGSKGLLVLSPFLALAAAGLVLGVWRRDEHALIALLIAACFAFVCFGYFDPYGGQSPGPRYFVIGLPFLTLGLAYLWPRWKVLTTAAVAVSVGLMTFEATAWGMTLRSLHLEQAPNTIWSRLGLPTDAGLALIWTLGAAALILSLAITPGSRFRLRPRTARPL